jgi:hypothetical protein
VDNKLLARRFVLPPALIVAVFFFFERSRPFSEVWKPLALYFAIAIPLFLIVDRLRARTR